MWVVCLDVFVERVGVGVDGYGGGVGGDGKVVVDEGFGCV